MILKLNISGMHCSACSTSIEQALNKMNGIFSSEINSILGRGKISYNPQILSENEIIKKIKECGFGASLDNTKKQEELEILALKRRFFVALPLFLVVFFLHMSGISLSVDFSGVFENGAKVDLGAYIQLIFASIAQFYCAAPFYRSSFLALRAGGADMSVLIALGSSVAYLYSIYLFYISGFGILDSMNAPHLAHSSHGFYFESSISVLCFILLGEFLKAKNKKQAVDAMSAISEILPKEALKVELDSIESIESNIESSVAISSDSIESSASFSQIPQIKTRQKVEIESIKKGELFLILAGEKIPCDGEIISGLAEVQSSHINGESMPRELKAGQKVIGGSIILNGELLVRATADFESFFVLQMLNILENAQERPAKIGAIADKIARIFVPCVVLLSICAFIFWSFFASFSFALNIAACVLLISCPCALGLAVPLAIVCGIVRAKRENVLFKDPETFERAAQISAVVFDKTGTLTNGTMRVVGVEILCHSRKSGNLKLANGAMSEASVEFNDSGSTYCHSSPTNCHSERSEESKNHEKSPNLTTLNLEILAIANALQKDNPHPISKAICEFCEEILANKNFTFDIRNLQEKKYKIAHGISAKYCGENIFFGSKKWILNQIDSIKKDSIESDDKNNNKTTIFLVINNTIKAKFYLEDSIKANAKDLVQNLQKNKIECIIISGDSKEPTAQIAKELGISKYFAEILPEEKGKIIQNIKAEKSGSCVAFVGDGVNDSIALKSADLGISFANASELAKQSGEILLLNSDLRGILSALNLSQKVAKNAKTNLFWAFAYNIILIPIAAGFGAKFGLLLNPAFAGFAMAASSLCVVGNALRILRAKI